MMGDAGDEKKVIRGKCPICDRRVRLKANGGISSHWYYADLRIYCSGIGKQPNVSELRANDEVA